MLRWLGAIGELLLVVLNLWAIPMLPILLYLLLYKTKYKFLLTFVWFICLILACYFTYQWYTIESDEGAFGAFDKFDEGLYMLIFGAHTLWMVVLELYNYIKSQNKGNAEIFLYVVDLIILIGFWLFFGVEGITGGYIPYIVVLAIILYKIFELVFKKKK